MNQATLTLTNCLDCPHHEIIADPDPYDSFCSDDEAVICKLTPNENKDLKAAWRSRRQDYKLVTSACRPYRIREESQIPDWCPLLKKEETK